MRGKAVVFVTSVVLLAGFVEISVYPGAAQQKAAQPAQKPKERTNPKDGAVMVYIPAGEFIRGSSNSDKDAIEDEKPQRRIGIPPDRKRGKRASCGAARGSTSATTISALPAVA